MTRALAICVALGVTILSQQWCYGQADPVSLSASEIAIVEDESPLILERATTVGTVIWINPYWHGFVIADESSNQGVVVELEDKEGIDALNVGDLVEVTGTVWMWEGRGCLKFASYETLGEGKSIDTLPVPTTLDVDQVLELDCQRVTVEGRIAFTARYFDRYVFWIDGYSIPVLAEFREFAKRTDSLQYPGARVRITGVAYQRNHGQSTGRRLLIKPNGIDDFEVLEPAPRWKTGPLSQGVVVCRKSENQYFFRASNGNILHLDVYDPKFLHVGAIVRYVGTAVETPTSRRVVVAGLDIYNTTRDWALSNGETPKQDAAKQSAGDWTKFRGATTPALAEELPNKYFTLVNENNEAVRIEIEMMPGDIESLLLSTANTVEASGYLDFTSSGTSIYPSNLRDIRVIDRKNWYESSRIWFLGLGLLGIMTAGLATIVSLRALVNRRTRDLAESSGLLTASYEAIHEGICVVDSKGAIKTANSQFWNLLGLSPSDVSGLQRDDVCRLLAERFTQVDEFTKLWISADDGRPRGDFDTVDEPSRRLTVYCAEADSGHSPENLGHVWVFHDVTQQKQLEHSLRQSQKMEAVGTLAAGVAHDFNNSLSAIVNFAEVAARGISGNSKEHEYVCHVLDAAKQAAGTTRGLLTFCGQQTTEKSPTDIVDLLKNSVTFLERLLPASIKITLDTPDSVELICRTDEAQLQQALLNLVVNARDAMPEGGEITITANANARNDFVTIVVADSGVGMSREILDRIFDPFFSTKGRGKGTGLGMSIVHGIVEDHGGTIDVDSTLGEGTTITIQLPLSRLELSELAPEDRGKQIGHGKTVLLVEDQLAVRKALVAQLEHSAFEVLQCDNGTEATEIFQANSAAIDVVLIDVDLPGIDGMQCRDRIKEISPDASIVLMSGSPHHQVSGDSTFLRKPFGDIELTATLKQAMTSKPVELSVLVIDDDPIVRSSTRALLQATGHRAILAATIAEAIEALEDKENPIKLILMDWNMPDGKGRDLIEKITPYVGEINVVIVTGDAGTEDEVFTQHAIVTDVLRKPFAADQLARAIQQTQLDREQED